MIKNNHVRLFQGLCLLSLLLVVMACDPRDNGIHDVNYYVGTQGLTLEYLDDYPEDEVYEQEPIPAILEIMNRGAIDVPTDKAALSFSYDPLYIGRSEDAPALIPIKCPGDCPSDCGGCSDELCVPGCQPSQSQVLSGRSAFSPDGSTHLVEIFDLFTQDVTGQRQVPETRLTAVLCYEYQTHLSTSVCIDVDQYVRSGREQSCESEDIRESSQGAPIAFRTVEVRNSPLPTSSGSRYVRPVFVVTLRNLGGGTVIAPPQEDFRSACRLQNIPEGESNAVFVNGTIFNIPLECNPALVHLRDGEGKTRCTIGEENLGNPALTIQQNIITGLQLDAFYTYRQAEYHDIRIVRDLYDDAAPDPDGPAKIKGYAYNGDTIAKDSDGNLLTLCREAADDKKSIGGTRLNRNWSCTCGTKDCLEMDDEGFCLYGLCPGNVECCDQAGYEVST